MTLVGSYVLAGWLLSLVGFTLCALVHWIEQQTQPYTLVSSNDIVDYGNLDEPLPSAPPSPGPGPVPKFTAPVVLPEVIHTEEIFIHAI